MSKIKSMLSGMALNIRRAIRDQIDLRMVDGKFVVMSPFTFDDGDVLHVALKNVSGRWMLTDEGHTLMHLDTINGSGSLFKGKNNKAIETALALNDLKMEGGEIYGDITGELDGSRYFDLVQCILFISTLSRIRLPPAKTGE